jgi:hypothetical protein
MSEIVINAESGQNYLGSLTATSHNGEIIAYTHNSSIAIVKNIVTNTIISSITIPGQEGIFGFALSGDGNTLALGMANENYYQGSVRIYRNSGSGYVQQTQIYGDGNTTFGNSLSLSYNGNKIIITNSAVNNGVYKIYDYISSTWTLSASSFNLIGSINTNQNKVYFSRLGDVLAILFPEAGGRVRVYKYISESWQLYGSEITPNAYSLSLSDDGNTIALGNLNVSSVYIYKYDNTTQNYALAATLTGTNQLFSDGTYNQLIGSAVALSGNGKTLATLGYYSTFAVYRYDDNTQIWDRIKLVAGTVREGNYFQGLSLSKNGKYVGYSVPLNVNGAIYISELETLNISLMSVSPSQIDYVSASSATISVVFSENASFNANQIIFSPSDVSLGQLSYNSETFTYSSTLIFPSASTDVSTNYTASIDYNSDISQNVVFQTNTYIPRVANSSSLFLDYRDISGNVLLTFDKPLLVDLSVNDFTNVDPSLTIISLDKVSSTEFNVKVGSLGSRYSDTKSFRCNYFGVSSDINVYVDTILPVLTNVSLSNNRLFNDSSMSVISAEFSKALHEDDVFSIENNFAVTVPSESFSVDITNLTSGEDNRQYWIADMTTSDMTVSRSHNNIVSVTYGGTTLSQSFSVNTSMLANSNICFPAKELVLTDDGYKPIEMIEEGVDTIYGKAIQHVTMTVTKDKTITFMERHCLMEGMPNKDTYISNNHKVLYKGKMVRASALQIDGVHQVNYTGEPLYNILLEGGDGKMVVNGMIVETLSHENNIAKLYDTLKHVKKNKNVFIEMYNKTYDKAQSFSK